MQARSLSLLALTVAAAAASLTAQSNVIPGRDIRLEDTFGIQRYRRTGTFPNGVQAVGMWTTCCNPGTSDIPFHPAMDPEHGFIHFLVVRESGGRLVQISNHAWVKHTFGSNNNPSGCGTCLNTTTTTEVHVGCNDTYGNTQAVDHYNLGPPSEVDPWLGAWDPICSHFDVGNPPVAPSQQCDGERSLTHAQANALNTTIGDAMRVYDDDLNVAGATFWYQSGYLVPYEAEALRDDNIGSRQFTPTFHTGTNQWVFGDGPNFLGGSVLQRWSGASIDSAANGTDDGRFYVAVKVTGPVNGLYHYEYAVHNRDNKRGMGQFRVPVCPDAQVSGFGFHDFDREPLSDWIGQKNGAEVVFAMPAIGGAPLRWNCLYNFWFDSDAAPLAGSVLVDQHDVGAGSLTVSVPSTTPSGVFNRFLGAGCGVPTAPTLFATGTPDRALIGNATLALRSQQNAPAALCAYLLALAPGATPVGACTIYASVGLVGPVLVQADIAGSSTLPLPVPNDPAMEGVDLDFQMLAVAAGGPLLGSFHASNGLRVRVGNAIPSCP